MKRIIKFNKSINDFKLDKFMKFIKYQQDEQNKNFFLEEPGKEHYKLLAYLSSLFNNEIFIDLGTFRGFSALALAYNQSNKVFSFDIEKYTINDKTQYSPDNNYNTIFMIDNILENPSRYYDLIKKSKVIFLDVDPHDGIKEKEFLEIIIKSHFSGLIICDDIKVNYNMLDWWNNITLKKYNLSDYGHWSGTGLIVTDPDILIDIEEI
jgi:predicted O-methyltransferase YrrM